MSLSKNENYRWVDGKSPNFLRHFGVALGCLAVLAWIINTSEPMSDVLVHAQHAPVITIETEPIYPPSVRLAYPAYRFDTVEEYNEWATEHQDDLNTGQIEIIDRQTGISTTGALVGPSFTTSNGRIDRTVYHITIFTKEQVREEES